jgi:hypothetical protein
MRSHCSIGNVPRCCARCWILALAGLNSGTSVPTGSTPPSVWKVRLLRPSSGRVRRTDRRGGPEHTTGAAGGILRSRTSPTTAHTRWGIVRSAAESESIAEEYESTLSLCLYCYLSLLCVEEADFCASPGNLAGKLALCREPRCARRDFTPRRAPGPVNHACAPTNSSCTASAGGVAVAPRRLLRPDHPPRPKRGAATAMKTVELVEPDSAAPARSRRSIP